MNFKIVTSQYLGYTLPTSGSDRVYRIDEAVNTKYSFA
ncbi:hypothetical protein COO91_02656 [Nostoc flagelliforme CCNUN1]|uniref:Uncharacterized protein n=1 Tax=Nostoc flagelliforme CCNUN1 TaxID=2038116 RepID=A0A2K8SN42_9NOSO|nr:hypothetical protein COO91_02656 [Nostoc flagelliforme CCNUN1]